MPDTQQQQPDQQPNGTVASAIHEATGAAKVLSMFSTDKLSLIALIVALGYVLFRGPQIVTEVNGNNIIALQEERMKDREASKDLSERFLKAQTEADQRRRESDKERDERFLRAFHEEQEKGRTAQADLMKSVLTELPKLTGQIQLLQAAILDLKRKVAPPESQIAPDEGDRTPRIHTAPMPREKRSFGSFDAAVGDEQTEVHPEAPRPAVDLLLETGALDHEGEGRIPGCPARELEHYGRGQVRGQAVVELVPVDRVAPGLERDHHPAAEVVVGDAGDADQRVRIDLIDLPR